MNDIQDVEFEEVKEPENTGQPYTGETLPADNIIEVVGEEIPGSEKQYREREFKENKYSGLFGGGYNSDMLNRAIGMAAMFYNIVEKNKKNKDNGFKQDTNSTAQYKAVLTKQKKAAIAVVIAGLQNKM